MGFAYRSMLFKVILASCCFAIIGVVLIFIGARNIIIDNSVPISVNEMQTNIKVYSHIELEEYQVMDVFCDEDDNAFFLIKTQNNYLYIESKIGNYYYNELSALIGADAGPHDFLINGYFVKSKKQLISFLESELVKTDYSTVQMKMATDYSVILLHQDRLYDRVCIGFGSFTFVFCVFSLVYGIKKKQKYYPDAKIWFL